MREFIGKIPEGFNPAIIHLVGAIVTWWARSEGLMVHDLRWMRSTDFGRPIAEKEQFPAQTRRTIRHWGKLLRALYADDTEALKVIETVSQEAFDLSDHRTALVHYFWPWPNNDPERIRLQSISGVKGDPDKLVILKYEASVDDLDDLNNRLYDLYNRVLKISMAPVDRHRDQSKGDRDGE